MKRSYNQMPKRLLSFVMAMAMMLSLLSGGVLSMVADAADGTTLYLKPNSNWLSDNARFAAYYFDDSGSGWADMTGPNEDDLYEVTIPDGYGTVIFCRMNSGTTENNWNNKWNQTADLTVPTDGTNCYTVADGTWDNGGGEWSTYTPAEPETPAATYIVAGVAGLCGSAWTPSDTANQMSLNSNGMYEKVYTNVAAGTYEFKVTDGTWDNCWGDNGNNYAFTVEAVSTVTILFDADTKAITVNVVAVPAETYIVAGVSGLCGSNWDPSDTANQMSLNSDGKYEKTYTNVAAGTYEFKVTDGTWDNCWGNNGSNYSFTLDEAGDVTIVFDPDTKAITVITGAEDTATYIVAGVAGLCGSEWSAGDTANQMTKNADGMYEKVYTNVAAGTYEFKITDGTWDNSWGDNGGNYSITVEAVSTVTILFNADTKAITVNVEAAAPAVDYYLIGYINGADYGCNDDYANLGEYKFVDGKLTATFTENSYVFVKTGDNQSWYMAESYCTDTSVTLKNTTTGAGEKLYVPGGVELTFTLTVNADDTLTLSYAEAESEVPAVDYYLIGYINGADYGCNDDYANLGEYKFVDGKLTVTFTQDSYVFVKTGDNANWYMAESYCTDTSVTLKKSSDTICEKMFVPGNQELTFTLVVNADDTLTLSYALASSDSEEEIPEGYTAVRIHFYKTEGWGSNVNAYIWTSGGALTGYEAYNTWPGKAISANATHPGWYDLTVATENPTAFNFIFNDGGNQTADLYTGEVTGDTELWVMGNDVMTTAPGEWSGDYDYTANIHFQKPENWGESINAYIWTNDGALAGYEAYNVWPGAAIEADAVNSGWYNVSVTMGEDTGFYFILNDGGNQTADLHTGTLQVKTDLWIVNGEVLTVAPENWVDPSRIVTIPGTFPGSSWDVGSNQMTYDPELGLYVYTFQNVPAANYEYKIAINKSWSENYGAGGVKDGSNIAVTVPKTQDVTIWYNDKTHNSVNSISYVFAEIELTGSGIPEGTMLTDEGLTGIYSVTVPLTAGTYSDIALVYQNPDGDSEVFAFSSFELTEDKNVTFSFDPSTGIYFHDGSDVKVGADAIYFNSQDEVYKNPFGAVAVGEEVTFSITTGDDVTQVILVIKGVQNYEMTKPEAVAYELGTQVWTCTATFQNIGEYDYYFVLTNGSDVAVYGDDDGYYGEGTVTDLSSVMAYDLVVYESGFETPDWMKNAVIYQIFPDRFFDGDETNNTAQTWARGAVDYEYVTDWYALPENPEQEAMLDKETYLATGAYYGDGEWSNEIYGGDIQGIIERIDYLKALGVNVIYLNPVFWSISNHRYDAVDYTEIDPILGTLGDFQELVAVAEANDMHIILDGVFNHVSDDSVYFDRYYKFLGKSEKIGAYPYWAYVYDYMAENDVDQTTAEGIAKTYFAENYGITDFSYTAWFKVSSTPMAGAVDNIGLRAGKEVYSYEGWWGYDSMPVIYSTNGSEYQTGNWAEEIISGSDSVNAYWISQGMDGWRLDVANEVSDETWQHFRDSVKALDSDAVIIGEIWDDATKYLMGDMYDSVMNYMFRNAVTSYAMGTNSEDTTKALEKIRERYPEESFYAMMNLVASHDTTRLLSYLDGIGDDRADKSLSAAFPTYASTSTTAKNRQYLVAFLQFTYPGAPTIYYGDEIGMVGSDDPDDRRAFTWGKGNEELVTYYATMAAVREAYPALRTGAIEMLDLDDSNLLAYIRSDDANELIVIANNGSSAKTVTLPGAKADTTYVDLVTGKEYTGTVTVSGLRGVVLIAKDQAQTITVNTAGLAPAYDSSYIVAERSAEPHTHTGGEATCTEKAVCTICGDAYGALDADNHGETELRNAKEATETTEGYTGDTYCTACGELVAKGETIPVKAHTHVLKKVSAVAATETTEGNIEYYVCDCGKLFSDAEGENEITAADTVVPKLTHTHKLTKISAIAATEYTEGNIEYYICACGKLFSDAEGKNEITAADTVVPKLEHTHELTKTAAKEATATTEGNIEYYTCTKCGKIYKDAAATKEISKADTVIPKTSDNADTGDQSHVMVWSLLLIVSAAGIAAAAYLMIKNKKRA